MLNHISIRVLTLLVVKLPNTQENRLHLVMLTERF